MTRTILHIPLDGGCHCFDFTNTINSRKDEQAVDYLMTYDDLLKWSKRVNLMPNDRLSKLRELANTKSKSAESTLKDIKKVREALYGVFSALAAKKEPDERDMKLVNVKVSQALSNLVLTYKEPDKQINWRTGTPQLEEPLWRILKSAYDLWAFNEIKRIKECEKCGWLFLDTSKNNRRRWCNMQNCGSTDKALRYYYRKKKEQESKK